MELTIGTFVSLALAASATGATAPHVTALIAWRRPVVCVAWDLGVRMAALLFSLPISALCCSSLGWAAVLAAQALIMYGLHAHVHLAYFHPLKRLSWPVALYIKVPTRGGKKADNLLKIIEALPESVKSGKIGTIWRVRSPPRVPVQGISVHRKPKSNSSVASALGPLDVVEVARGAKKWIRVAGGWAPCMSGKLMMIDPFHLLRGQCDPETRTDCRICQKSDVSAGNISASWLRKLACGHLFHPSCIEAWFDDHNTCPVCGSSKSPGRRRIPQNVPGSQAPEPDRKSWSNSRKLPRPDGIRRSSSSSHAILGTSGGGESSSAGELTDLMAARTTPSWEGPLPAAGLVHKSGGMPSEGIQDKSDIDSINSCRSGKSGSSSALDSFSSGSSVFDRLDPAQPEMDLPPADDADDFPSLSSLTVQPTNLTKMVNRLNGNWAPEDELLTRGYLFTLEEDDGLDDDEEDDP